jgi:membrane protease YdiL (CAAX protease family)
LLEPVLDSLTYTLIGLAVKWALAFSVLAVVLLWERQPLASIGLRWPSWKWLLAALGFGIGLSLLVPLLTILVSAIIPPSETGTITETTSRFPPWLILVAVITAGFTEELLFRAYPLERLTALTSNVWLASALSLAAFVSLHLAAWSPAHVFGVVLPLGAILIGLYLWRRNLVFVAVTHIVIDLPLVLLALAPSA